MPKKNCIAMYELLFKEGTMVAERDIHMPKNPELKDKNVPNLHIMRKHFFWKLTREGLPCLCDDLHMPPGTGPATLHHTILILQRARLTQGEADSYTSRPSPGANKKAEAVSATEFQFRGEFGHRCPPQC
ncbi:unnamed protein product [Nyctereutes procyonoides]|uniref:Small ribosomal subunit protein eS10 n=1 Tax=Nyctereutes procyonoides TaxID=34880 RepID=A0A811Z482_NYCPR|nr:unnamed protein product [Nyctereutes procyonoides]